MNIYLDESIEPSDQDLDFIELLQKEIWLAESFDGDEDHWDVNLEGNVELQHDSLKLIYFLESNASVSLFEYAFDSSMAQFDYETPFVYHSAYLRLRLAL